MEVVHTVVYNNVAYHGAEMLINLLKRHPQTGKKCVHVGFAGGYAMRPPSSRTKERICF